MLRLVGRPLVFALLVGSWVAVVGCGDDDDPDPTPTPTAGAGGEGGGEDGTGGTTGGTTGGKGGSSPGGAGAGGEAPSGESGIATIATAPFRTTEAGGQKTFRVVLETQPTAAVTVPLASSDESEGTVAPSSLTFTSANWNAPQLVTVSGVDDDDTDGDVTYEIEIGPAESADPSYDGLEGDPVELVNTDDETAGVTVALEGNDDTTSEAGGQARFRVVLNSEPTADVRIALESDDDTEGTATPVSLVFTTNNWNAPQIVTVTGVDDDTKDGDQEYSIVLSAAESSDPAYDGLDPDDVELVNIDDESAGVSLEYGEEGLLTGEDGTQDTFRIALNAPPTANVTFPLSSSDEGEGTVSPSSVTFTPNNWDAPQVVTVTGEDDDELDGLQPYEIEIGAATSTDAEYSGLSGGSVPAANEDDESAGVRIEGADRQTSESGGTGRVRIRLSAAPTANVTIALSSSDPTEGSISTGTLLFTPNNWDAPQTVIVTGVDDDVADGNQEFRLVTEDFVSDDEAYDGLDVPDATFVNVDDDTPGVTVTPLTITTTEAGGDATFSVVLNSEPFANVSIGIASDEEEEAVPSPTMLTFTPANWDAPQIVTVTGQDDDIDDGNQVFFVRVLAADSTDLAYDGLDGSDVEVTNTDDESAGFTVTPEDGLTTTEDGETAEFSVVLNSEPTADVTVALSSSEPDEGTPSPTTLTFTTENWNVPQTVTVTGQDDDIDDGNQTYFIELEAAESADEAYQGVDPPDVELSNTDDETAGITVQQTPGLTTSEAGGTAEFTVVLESEPTADVTIAVSSSEPDEGTPSPTTLTFTPGNWNTPQTVTVTGEDDDIDDGNQTYTILLAAAESTDTNYDGIDAEDVEVTNQDDDDTVGISVSETTLFTIEEIQIDSIEFVLDSEPTGDVTISLTSTDPDAAIVSESLLTFTPANWNVPQIVLGSAVPDADADNEVVEIEWDASSTDLSYDAFNGSFNIEVTDDDGP